MSESNETTRETIKRLTAKKAALHAPKRKPRPINHNYQVAFSPNAGPPRVRVRDTTRDRIRVKCGCHSDVFVSYTAAASAHQISPSSITNAFKRAGADVAMVKEVRFERVD